MTKLIRVGFFSEMPHGDPEDPSLAEACADAPAPNQDELAAYLEAGHVYIATPGFGKDVLNGGARIPSPHYMTDGKHVWPGDVAHYVRTYHVRLPQEFVDEVAAAGFTVPADVDVTQLKL